MEEQDKLRGRQNHPRNLAIIAAGLVFVFLAWNAFGAVQCISRGGDFSISGFNGTCFLDLSDPRVRERAASRG
ncbi:hypothetical protein ACW9UR_04385 [Halovulum sp. GXIMD14794]